MGHARGTSFDSFPIIPTCTPVSRWDACIHAALMVRTWITLLTYLATVTCNYIANNSYDWLSLSIMDCMCCNSAIQHERNMKSPLHENHRRINCISSFNIIVKFISLTVGYAVKLAGRWKHCMKFNGSSLLRPRSVVVLHVEPVRLRWEPFR
jgi:hypothetical protein